MCRASKAAKAAQKRKDNQQVTALPASEPPAEGEQKTPQIAQQRLFSEIRKTSKRKLSQSDTAAAIAASTQVQQQQQLVSGLDSKTSKNNLPQSDTTAAAATRQLPQQRQRQQSSNPALYTMPNKRISLSTGRLDLTPSRLRKDSKQQPQEVDIQGQAAQRAQAVLGQDHAVPAELSHPSSNDMQQQLQSRPAAPQQTGRIEVTKAQLKGLRQRANVMQADDVGEVNLAVAAELPNSKSNDAQQQQQEQLQSRPAALQQTGKLKVTKAQLEGLRQRANVMQADNNGKVKIAVQKRQKQVMGLNPSLLAEEKSGKAYLQQVLELACESDKAEGSATLQASAKDTAVRVKGQEGMPDAASQDSDTDETFVPHSLAQLKGMKLLQLRPLCQKYGLPISGRKDLLVLRVLAHEAGLCLSMGL